MAEFCLECLNKQIEDKKEYYDEKDMIMSFDFCEGCEEWKMCAVSLKRRYRIKRALVRYLKGLF